MRRKPHTILAVDPGLHELGYAVLDGPRLLDANVISLRLVPRARRMPAARSAVRRLCRLHQPDALVLEQTHRYPNGLHRIVPAMRRLARDHRIPLAIYSPQAVRKALLGNGWAGKEEAARAMRIRYPALRIYRGQATKTKDRYWFNLSDAVALATYHRLQK